MSLPARVRQWTSRLRGLDTPEARIQQVSPEVRGFIDRVNAAHPIQTVFDVGANHGRMASFFADYLPNTSVHAFEPLPGCRVYLDKLAQSNPRVTPHTMAVGERSAQLEMFENAYDQSSSLMPMMERHRELWPETTQMKKISVPVEPLDVLVPRLQASPPFFLKIDTQGYEMNVLKGAVQSLRSCAGVMMEVLFEPLYEGQPDLRALLNFMAEHGFRFAEFVEEHRVEGKLIFADAAFESEALTT